MHGLRSADGKIYPSVVFVRLITALIWSVASPPATPIVFYAVGKFPVWANRAAIVLGSLLIVAVPLMDAQPADALQAVREAESRINERINREHSQYEKRFSRNEANISNIKDTVTRTDVTVNGIVKTQESFSAWQKATTAGVFAILIAILAYFLKGYFPTWSQTSGGG